MTHKTMGDPTLFVVHREIHASALTEPMCWCMSMRTCASGYTLEVLLCCALTVFGCVQGGANRVP